MSIRSALDLLIVQTVLENDLILLHDDKDFTAIRKVVLELALY